MRFELLIYYRRYERTTKNKVISAETDSLKKEYDDLSSAVMGYMEALTDENDHSSWECRYIILIDNQEQKIILKNIPDSVNVQNKVKILIEDDVPVNADVSIFDSVEIEGTISVNED